MTRLAIIGVTGPLGLRCSASVHENRPPPRKRLWPVSVSRPIDRRHFRWTAGIARRAVGVGRLEGPNRSRLGSRFPRFAIHQWETTWDAQSPNPIGLFAATLPCPAISQRTRAVAAVVRAWRMRGPRGWGRESDRFSIRLGESSRRIEGSIPLILAVHTRSHGRDRLEQHPEPPGETAYGDACPLSASNRLRFPPATRPMGRPHAVPGIGFRPDVRLESLDSEAKSIPPASFVTRTAFAG